MVTTWLNGECWNNIEDIGSYSDANDKINSRKCKCGEDTEIKDSCFSCHFKESDREYDREINKINVQNGIGILPNEAKSDYYQRCRERCLKGGGMGRAIAAR
jgi:hypothetical protein